MMGKQAKGVSAERELKRIFLGVDEMSSRPQFTETERAGYQTAVAHPFLSVRSAASLQVDLLVCKQNLVLPFEIKASSKREFHFSSGDLIQAQLDGYIEISKHYGLLPLYAFRLSNTTSDPWRIFLCPISRSYVSSEMLPIYDAVPAIGRNSLGNYQMSWNDGLPLHQFLILLHQITCLEQSVTVRNDLLWSCVRAMVLRFETMFQTNERTSVVAFLNFSPSLRFDRLVYDIELTLTQDLSGFVHERFDSEFLIEASFYRYQTALDPMIVRLLDRENLFVQTSEIQILGSQRSRVTMAPSAPEEIVEGRATYLLEHISE